MSQSPRWRSLRSMNASLPEVIRPGWLATRPGRLWALVVLLLLAFALRVHDLAEPSLWSEEGLNLYRAGRPLTELLRGQLTIDSQLVPDNPSLLYTLLLRPFAGSVFAARMVAVWAGVLAVPLLYATGRTLLNRPAGLAAALLLTISPYHTWLSREVGPETWLLLASLLIAWGLGRWLKSVGQRRGWLLLFSGGILLLLLALPRFPLRPGMSYVYMPLHALPVHAAGLLGVGVAPGLVQQWWRYVPALVLAPAGALALWRHHRAALRFLLLYLAPPFLLLWALAEWWLVATNPLRYLSFLLPPLLLLVSAGWLYPWQRWRGRALALGLVLLLVQTGWLVVQFRAPELHKEDVRGLAAQLSALARPEDHIILQDAGIAFAFAAYYDGAAPWRLLPPAGPAAVEEVISQLDDIAQAARRVWLVTQPGPRTGFPPGALTGAAANWPHLYTEQYPALWLPLEVAVYTPRPLTQNVTEDVEQVQLSWGDELYLEGYGVPAVARSAGLWQPIFYWRKTAQAAGQYTLFLRLVDAHGVTQAVEEWLLWEAFPPGFWPEGEMVRYEPLVRLPAGLPPGPYQAWLQVVRTADGQPLSLDGSGSELLLTPALMVEAATAPAGLAHLPPFTPQRTHFAAGVTMLGYAVDTEQAYRPGHTIPVRFTWQLPGRPAAEQMLYLRLVDPAGEVVQELLTPPPWQTIPAETQPVDMLLVTEAELLVPAEAAGRYEVEAVLLPGGEVGTADTVQLASVEVLPWPLETTFPAIDMPFRADFGDPAVIELHGYALSPATPSAGEVLDLTLYWKAAGPVADNWMVFVHVQNAAGEVVAQGDGPPLNGSRPTAGWRTGEVLVDQRTLWLPPELPAGSYSVWVGFYHPQNGARLPAMTAGERVPDDRVQLFEIQINP